MHATYAICMPLLLRSWNTAEYYYPRYCVKMCRTLPIDDIKEIDEMATNGLAMISLLPNIEKCFYFVLLYNWGVQMIVGCCLELCVAPLSVTSSGIALQK